MILFTKNTGSIVIVLVFGFILFFIGTDGFQAYTAEQARTNALIDEQPVFPMVTLEDSKERTYPFSEFQGKYAMLTFIYTACADVCPELERNLAEVYDAVPDQYIGEEIMFLSISFDPKRDTPEILAKYQDVFEADGETWRMARITDEAELQSLLDEFGVIVIPDANGHYAHNSAFYLVNPEGVLIDVMDYQKPGEAAEKVINILDEEAGEQL
jgi:protein SCO1/2